MLKELIPMLFRRNNVHKSTAPQPLERSWPVPTSIPVSAADGTISLVKVVFDPEHMPFSEAGLNKLSVLAESTEHVGIVTGEAVKPSAEELVEEFEEQPEAPQPTAPELPSEDPSETVEKVAQEKAAAQREEQAAQWEDFIIFGIPPGQNSKLQDLGNSQLDSVEPQWAELPAPRISRNPLLRKAKRSPFPLPSVNLLPEVRSPLALIPEQQKAGPLARLRLVIAPILIALVARSSSPASIFAQPEVGAVDPAKTTSVMDAHSMRSYGGTLGIRPADDTPDIVVSRPPSHEVIQTDSKSGRPTLRQAIQE